MKELEEQLKKEEMRQIKALEEWLEEESTKLEFEQEKIIYLS